MVIDKALLELQVEFEPLMTYDAVIAAALEARCDRRNTLLTRASTLRMLYGLVI